MIWLPFASNSSVADSIDDMFGSEDIGFGNGITINGDRFSTKLTTGQDRLTHDIVSHSDDSGSAVYDRIFLGMKSPDPLHYPFPVNDVEYFHKEYVGESRIFRLDQKGAAGIAVDPEVKYTFKFLSSHIPDVKNIFIIHGQKYVCRNLTATFSRFGMSSILKGEFFRCVE